MSQSRMSVVKQVMLLLLLALIGTNAALGPEDCAGLNVTLSANQLHEIYGGWVLVWSIADNLPFSSLISNLSSSKIELRLLPDNNTITYNEWNLFQDKSCTRYLLNMSLVSGSENFTLNYITGTVEKNGVVNQYNDSFKVTFFKTCPDCLMMVYRGDAGQILLSYKKEGHHQDVEQLKASHRDNEKMAECLGLPHANAFSYDGAADFCPKTSPPAAVELERP